MKITFHAGLLKTGTTYIQTLLQNNRDRWSDWCIVSYEGPSRACRKPGQVYCRTADPKALPAFRAALIDLRSHMESSGKDKGLISDENMYLRELSDASGHMFDWLQRGITVTQEVFADHDVTFVFGLRDYEAWKTSPYGQLVKRNGETRIFSRWDKEFPLAPPLQTLLDEIAKATGAQIETFDFDAEVAPNQLGRSLLEQAGFSSAEVDKAVFPAQKANPTLPEGSLELMRRLNNANIPQKYLLRASEVIERAPRLFVKTRDEKQRDFKREKKTSPKTARMQAGKMTRSAVARRQIIRAHMATYPPRKAVLKKALTSICGQVEQLYLCLNEYRDPPSFLSQFPNVIPHLPDQDLKDVGKFAFDCGQDDIIFLTDDDLIYAPDYVKTMMAQTGRAQLEAGIFGLHGIRYRETEKGVFERRKPPRVFFRGYRTTVRVDQLGTGTVMLLGKHMPPLDVMQGSQKFTDVRFARFMFERGLPLWSVSRRAGLIKKAPLDGQDTIWQTFTIDPPAHVKTEISSFATRAEGLGKPLKS